MHVTLLDADNQPVGPGESGEICVRGPLVMDGYKDLPDETAEALSGGWLHTGDVGRFDDEGFLYIVDRTKDMVITGGFNVFPREVEDVHQPTPRSQHGDGHRRARPEVGRGGQGRRRAPAGARAVRPS